MKPFQENATTGYDYKWLDGSNLTYEPKIQNWPTKNQLAHFIILLPNGTWENEITPDIAPTGVVCQMKVDHPHLTTISTQSKPNEDPQDPCNYKDKTNFSFTHHFRSESCYFAIKGSVLEANTPAIGGGYLFDVTKARETCKRYNATLPIIGSKEENTFLEKLMTKESIEVNVPLGLTKVRKNTKY